jgi:hypothetical protein
MKKRGVCPLITSQIIDEYFVENRTRLLDIAAFLDRLDRSSDGRPAAEDFRIQAFARALRVLSSSEGGKIDQLQLIFSDLSVEPKEVLDTKSASGAWNPMQEVR